ncbi:MAG: hypothetical protein GX434_07505 [Peptococcaceae bacterium]|nr:hypothetical protein [Peptococcaceae bacterium]
MQWVRKARLEFDKYINHDWLRNITAIIGINLLLAFTSLLKDIFFASYLGTSSEADAFLLSYFIIDTVGNNLWAAALGVAFLPAFSEMSLKMGRMKADQMFGQISLLSVLTGVIFIVLFYLFRFWVVDFIGQGLEQQVRVLAGKLLVILLPALILFPLINVGISVLQVDRRFKLSAFSPVIFNSVLLGGTIIVWFASDVTEYGVMLLSGFILISVFIQFFYTWSLLGAARFPKISSIFDIHGVKTNMKKVSENFTPYFLVLLTSQVTYAVERYLASGLGEGTLAALNYAFRIVQFPVWVFIAAISAVAFPTLSRKLLLEGQEMFRMSVKQFLTVGLLLTIPMSIILFMLNTPIVSILFERGSFRHESTVMTSGIMSGYTLSIAWQGLSALLIRVCLLKDNKNLPLLAAVISMLVNILLDLLLVKDFGAAGLGYGAAIGTFVNFSILFLFLRKELGFFFTPRRQFILPFTISNSMIFLASISYGQWWNTIENCTLPMKWGSLSLFGFASLSIYMASYIWTKHTIEPNQTGNKKEIKS